MHTVKRHTKYIARLVTILHVGFAISNKETNYSEILIMTAYHVIHELNNSEDKKNLKNDRLLLDKADCFAVFMMGKLEVCIVV